MDVRLRNARIQWFLSDFEPGYSPFFFLVRVFKKTWPFSCCFFVMVLRGFHGGKVQPRVTLTIIHCIICSQDHIEPGSKLLVLGMVIQPLIGNPYNGYINPYYWVDDHPLLYGNNGSLDPSTHESSQKIWVSMRGNQQGCTTQAIGPTTCQVLGNSPSSPLNTLPQPK